MTASQDTTRDSQVAACGNFPCCINVALVSEQHSLFPVVRDVGKLGARVVEYVGDEVEARELLVEGRVEDAEGVDEHLNHLVGRLGVLQAPDHRLADLYTVRGELSQQVSQPVALSAMAEVGK